MIKKPYFIRINEFALVFSLFAVLYFFIVFLILPDLSPFMKYPLLASQYLRGVLELNRIPDLSPLYFYFNILISYFTNSLELTAKIIQIIQILLTALTALLFYKILNIYFSKILSVTGLILFALSVSIPIYTKIIEPEPFVIFFLIAFIYFIVKEDMNKKNVFFSGIFFALGVFTRANFFPLILIIPIFFRFKRKEGNWIKNTVLFGLPLLFVLGFLIIRNYSISGEFSPYSADPGYVFFEGNNPNSTGQSALYPPLVSEIAYEYPNKPDYHHQIYKLFARKITGRNLTINQANNFWKKKAFNYISDYPIKYFELISLKIQYFFHNYRRHDLENAFLYDKSLKKSLFPFIPFWIISAMSLIGILSSVRKWKENFIFLAVYFMQFLALVLIYVSERQRIAVLTIFIFFALRGVDYLFNKRKIWVFVILIIFSYFSLYMATNLMKEEDYIWDTTIKSHNLILEAKRERADYNVKRAKKKMYEAISATPWLLEDKRLAYLPFNKREFLNFLKQNMKEDDNFSKRFSDSILLIKTGDYKYAEKILTDLYLKSYKFKRDYYGSSEPLYYLGIIEEKRGNFRKALNYFAEVLKNNPGSPYSLSHAFALTGKDEFYEKIIRYFDRADADFFTGKAFYNLRMYRKARIYFERLLKLFPMYRKVYLYNVAVLSHIKYYRKSAELYLKALKMRIDPIFFETEITDTFESIYNYDKKNQISKFYLGMVSGQYGNYRKAIKLLNEVKFDDKKRQDAVNKELLKIKKILGYKTLKVKE